MGDADEATWPQTEGPFTTAPRLRSFVAKTVWEEFTPLAKETKGERRAKPCGL